MFRHILAGMVLTCLTWGSVSAQRIYAVAGGPGFGRTAPNVDLRINKFFINTDQHVIFSSEWANIGKIDPITQIVTSIAGTGAYGEPIAGESAAGMKMHPLRSIALTSNGDFLFAYGTKIWKLNKSSGLVSLFAGAASYPGFTGDGGPAMNATFSSIEDIAINNAGDVFVADWGNFRIRKIDHATGVVTTIIGNGSNSSTGDGGQASAASAQPNQLAMADNGDLYFSENLFHVVRKIDAITGLVNRIAGTYTPGSTGDGGQATSAALNNPGAMLIEGDNLYIADFQSYKIRKVVLSTGIISTYAGSGTRGFSPDGQAAAGADLGFVRSFQMVGGDLWFSESGRLRKITGGLLATVGGTGGFSGDGGLAQYASLSQPEGAVLNQAGDLIFSDQANNRIRKIDHASGIISTIAGTGVEGFSGDNGPASAAAFYYPRGLAIDGSDNLFVCDQYNNRIRRIDGTTGTVTTVAGTGVYSSSGDDGLAVNAELLSPSAIAIDADGNLFIAEYTASVRKVDATTGIITRFAGNGTTGYAGDGGPATLAQLSELYAVVADNDGNVYIADETNRRIRKVDLGGTISTIAGPDGPSDQGPALNSFLNFPTSLSFDLQGNLLIGTQRLLMKLDLNAETLTLISGSGPGLVGDGGPALDASSVHIGGIAVDAQNNIFITDVLNGTIRKIVPRTLTQTITFNPIPAQQVGPATLDLNVFGSSSAALPLTYVSSNPAVASVSGSTVTMKTAGSTIITASQPGNVDYLPAANSPTQTLVVNKGVAPLSITSSNSGPQGTTIDLKSSKGQSTGSVSYTVANESGKAVISAGTTLLLTSKGTVTVTAHIAEDANYLAGTTTQQVTIANPIPAIFFTSSLTGNAGTSVDLSIDKGGSTGVVSFALENLSGDASLAGNVLTLINAGSVKVKSSIAADADYDAATVEQVFTILNTDGTSVPVTPNIYGTTTRGGTYNAGVLYTMPADLSSASVLRNFTAEPGGALPTYSQMLLASDGKLYGVNPSGGLHNAGVIFSYEPGTGNYTVVHHFDPTTGSSSMGRLFQAANGLLYGLTNSGGANGLGVLFSFDPSDGTYTKKADLSSVATGGQPYSGLIEGTPGMLYGAVNTGGSAGGGTIIRYDIASNTLTKRYDFDNTSGMLPVGSLLKASSGKLYGLVSQGGSNGGGTIIEFDPSNDNLAVKVNLDFLTQGGVPLGAFVEAANGKLYAMCAYGGSNFYGTLIEYTPGATSLIVRHAFELSDGIDPFGSLVEVPNGKLYGLGSFGSANFSATVIEFDPASNTFTKKLELQKEDGATAIGSFALFTNGKLYATVLAGGLYNSGTLIEYDPANTVLIKKRDFALSIDGANPASNIVSSNRKLYSSTAAGAYNSGTVFEYNPSNGDYQKLLDVTASYGSTIANIVAHPDGNLYMLTKNNGTLIRLNPSTGSTTTLYTFNNQSQGFDPAHLILASNGKLYGTTSRGGASFNGVIFEFNPASGVYTKKFDASFLTTGASPGKLIEGPEGKLYGTMQLGGASHDGTVFSFDITTGIFTLIASFNGTNGIGPRGYLSFGNNGKLYGLTSAGGANAKGVLFEVDIPNATITKKLDLNNSVLDQGLIMQPGGTMLGFLSDGGSAKLGALFEYNPVANSLTQRFEFNGINGAQPAGDLLIIRAKQSIAFNPLPSANLSAGTVTLTATASSGLPVAFTSSDPTVATVTGNVVTFLNSGSVLITANQIGNGTFEPAPAVARFLTIKKPQTINFSAIGTKKYGDVPFNITATTTANLLVTLTSSNTNVATVSGNTITIQSAGSTNLIASQSGNSEYEAAADVVVALEVAKASQTITFNAIGAKKYGDVPFNIVATATSNLSTTFISSNPNVATVSGNTVTILSAGSTNLIASQSGNDNYEAAADMSIALDVNKALQAITFNAIGAKKYGDAPFNLTATTSSNLPVTFSSSNTNTATVIGNTVTIVSAGSTNLIASQPGNSNYEPAADVSLVLEVAKASQTIAFSALVSRVLGSAPFTVAAISTSNLPVTFTTSSSKLSIVGSLVTLTEAGRATIKADQQGNSNYAAAAQVEQSFCINPPMPTISVTNNGATGHVLTSSNLTGNQWYLDGAIIASATSSTITVTAPGNYSVKSTVDDCASSLSDAVTIVVTGLELTTGGTIMSVYPTVFDRSVFVEVRSPVNAAVAITITDMMGRSYHKTEVRTNHVNEIVMDNFAPSYYFVHATTSSGVYSKRILKKN